MNLKVMQFLQFLWDPTGISESDNELPMGRPFTPIPAVRGRIGGFSEDGKLLPLIERLNLPEIPYVIFLSLRKDRAQWVHQVILERFPEITSKRAIRKIGRHYERDLRGPESNRADLRGFGFFRQILERSRMLEVVAA